MNKKIIVIISSGILLFSLTMLFLNFSVFFQSESVKFEIHEEDWEKDMDYQKAHVVFSSSCKSIRDIIIEADRELDTDELTIDTRYENGAVKELPFKIQKEESQRYILEIKSKRGMETKKTTHIIISMPKSLSVNKIEGSVQLYTNGILIYLLLVFLLISAYLVSFNRFIITISPKCIPLIICIAAAIGVCSIEVLGNSKFNQMDFLCVIKNLICTIIVYSVLCLILLSSKLGLIFGTILFLIIGIVNYYLLEFRGLPFQLSDLFSAKTAVNVIGNYQFVLSYSLIIVVSINMIWLLLLINIDIPLFNHVLLSRFKRLLTGIGMACFFWSVVFLSPFSKLILPSVSYWNSNETFQKYGFVLSFLGYAKDIGIKKPAEYNKKDVINNSKMYIEKADKLNTKYETFALNKPDIIVIMNEALSDYRHISDPVLSENVFSFWDSLNDNTKKGWLNVPTYAGGTANTEYEVLTGDSMGYFNGVGVPYVMYTERIHNGLPFLLKQLGYKTVAMHPNAPSNYARNYIYPNLGFDVFYSANDLFEDSERMRNMVSDKGNYCTMLNWIEKEGEDSPPLFIFNVTMQNHSKYKKCSIPISVYSKKTANEETNEYFTLIKESDNAFSDLIDSLKRRKRKTIVVAFGDHFPELDDEDLLAGENSWIRNNGKYQTPLLIWANYDMEECDDLIMSSNYLGAYLFDMLGFPKTGFQTFLLELKDKYPIITSGGYIDNDGNIGTFSDSGMPSEIINYFGFQYNHLQGNSLQAFYEGYRE